MVVKAINDIAVAQFRQHGFTVLRQIVPKELCDRVRTVTQRHLDPVIAPVEYEAEVGYPGAPENLHTEGGKTPRRLLQTYARDQVFDDLVRQTPVVQTLQGLLGNEVEMSQCHHNCVMTKCPGYSSTTLWHQDIRYWSFDRPELVTAWYALGDETRRNGALRVIPGSHTLDLDRGRLDSELFLRPDLPENKTLIRQAQIVELSAGDVLLFHCRLFHAAGQNGSDTVKLSPVFTFHEVDNKPIPGTRSAQWQSIRIAP